MNENRGAYQYKYSITLALTVVPSIDVQNASYFTALVGDGSNLNTSWLKPVLITLTARGGEGSEKYENDSFDNTYSAQSSCYTVNCKYQNHSVDELWLL